MKRREFIGGLAGAAAWPLAARALPAEGIRRMGVLNSLAEHDGEGQARFAALKRGLLELGWSEGQNIRIEARWAAGDPERFRGYAAELVALAPDVITAAASPSVSALLRATRSVPPVFANVTDPV